MSDATRHSSENVMIISADCHAGAQPATYREYLPKGLRAAYDEWQAAYEAEMEARTGTFYDQEAEDARNNDQSVLRAIEGEWDPVMRIEQLESDGIAGEVIFPQQAPFGGGLLQYRTKVDPAQNLEGQRAYNRWLADLCNENPGRHAGVAMITVEDVDVAVKDTIAAKEMGLWGGVLIPAGTGDNAYYHDPRYEPLWATCEELDMPVHTHSGWSPDYGDSPAATAMFVCEVSWYANRAFTCFTWAGVFERYPKLKLVMTEQGSRWILDRLETFDKHYTSDLFKYFGSGLSLKPSEYFARQCYFGASMLTPEDCALRHEIGVDKLMWGSDYPHLEGTWPHTMESLQATFGQVESEQEVRDILGLNAARVFGFDVEAMSKIADRIGPSLDEVRGQA
jgi:predicted TIM-barrel fold metal-dependent hydrolase